MSEHGRGAWNNAGVGGTKKYKDAGTPGPYYYLGTGEKTHAGARTNDEYAVFQGVKAYQRALNRRSKAGLKVDGVFGEKTSAAVTAFQEKHSDVTGAPWGGIGPQTSEALLTPDAAKAVAARPESGVSLAMVTGTVRHEGIWDCGAVGYLDQTDLGLAQINGTAHPDMSRAERLKPVVAFNFIIDYYERALKLFDGNVRDAVASYNLGAGGTRSWIAAGRPDSWTPAGQDRPRDVKGYIDRILQG